MKDDSLTNDQVLGQWLKELKEFPLFKAQAEIEARLIASHTQRLQTLDLSSARLEVEYVKVRARLDALKEMQALRDRLIENRNNR